MVRNLLYSLCIHLLFLLMLMFGDTFSVNNKPSTSIMSLDIGTDFNIYSIKTTKSKKYENLSLNDKIKIYKYKMEHKNEIAKKQTTVNSPNSIEPLNTDKLLDILNTKAKYDKQDKIYLGPTAYAKLQRRLETLKNNNDNRNQTISSSDITSTNLTTIDNNLQNKNNRKINNVKNELKQLSNDMKNIDINEIFTKEDLSLIKKSITQNNMSNLSNREKKIIQQQLESCWRTAIVKNNVKSKAGVLVEVEVSKNGFFNMKKVSMKIIDTKNKYSKEEYENTIKNAKTALVYCSPLRNLPVLKYDSWKKINFVFSGSSN